MSSPSPASGSPKKGPKKLILIVVALASLAGGAAMPMMLGGEKKDPAEEAKKKHAEHPPINIPFGDVTVNLAEERLSRYLRIKLVLKVEGAHEEEEGVKMLAPVKPVMKSWLLAHLAGKSTKDVQGTVGVKRLQREIFEKFEEMMEAEAHSHGPKDKKPHLHLKEVLFEEYIVQ